MKRITLLRDEDYPDGAWRNRDGRPTAEKTVKEWRAAHPDGKKADCIRETGLDKKTVYKWWEPVTPEPAKERKKPRRSIMTEAQKKEYELLTENCEQLTLELDAPVPEEKDEMQRFYELIDEIGWEKFGQLLKEYEKGE